MIANPQVNHRLPWWSYPLVGGVLAVLPCVPVRGQSDEPKDSQAPRPTQPINATADAEDDNLLEDLYNAELGDGYKGPADSKRDSHKSSYRLPDYLPAAHGNAVSAGGDRYYGLTPYGSDRVWHVHYFQDTADGFGKTLWDATLKLPPEDELKQGDTFALNISKGIVTVAVVEDDYVNDRDIGIKQLDVKTGAIEDERTLLRHMARYQPFLSSMQGEDDAPKTKKNESAPSDGGKAVDGKRDDGKKDAGGQPATMDYEEWDRTFGFSKPHDYGFPHGRWVGNDLILELECTDGANLIDSALDLWRKIYGDTPVEQIRTSREDGKPQIIIRGKSSPPPNGEVHSEGDKQGFKSSAKSSSSAQP